MAQNLRVIKIQKPEPKKLANFITKTCDTCGQPFEAAIDSKFVRCLTCYQKTKITYKPFHKLTKKKETQTFTQIICINCKSFSYLSFIPPNINAAYCDTCYSKLKHLSQKSKLTKLRAIKDFLEKE